MRIISFGIIFSVVAAATHRYNWTVGWQIANPDGLKDRQVVAINNVWPMPVLRAKKGDRLEIWVHNNLTNPVRNSSVHFHGIYQNGTNDMDGPTFVTQCPGAPGTTFFYNFTIDQNGTYWYHTHTLDLYPDGYRQMFLVDDDHPWFEDDVDEEIPISITDWYHVLTENILDTYLMNPRNPVGRDPVPDSFLVNDTLAENIKYQVKPSKTYRLRIVHTGAYAGFYWYIPGQNVTIVEVDGIYTEPANASSLYISPGQRVSVLFNTTADPDAVYQAVQIADAQQFPVIPSTLQLNHTMWFYTGDESKDPTRFKNVTNEDIFNSGIVNTTGVTSQNYTAEDILWFDDMDLIPYDRMELLENPDVNITLDLRLGDLDNGEPYAFFNNITWTAPKVPSLYTVIDAPDDDTALNATIYGEYTNSYVVDHMDIVQLVLNSDGGRHPFHLHGHNFQSLRRDVAHDTLTPYDPDSPNNKPFPKYPMRRDTLTIMPNSNFVVRWRADNPGVWFFHCHIDWHLSQGLAMEFIEAPVQIRQNYRVHPILQSNLDTCALSGMPDAGNAAGNTTNYYYLADQNRQLPGAVPYTP